jgi:hypothetical protein
LPWASKEALVVSEELADGHTVVTVHGCDPTLDKLCVRFMGNLRAM